MIKDFKNYNDIKNAIGGVRGENIDQKDLTLIFFDKYLEENYNLSGRDTVEFSVYDMEDNQILWTFKNTQNTIYNQFSPSKLILKPGDDLRSNNIQRGQYRVVYDFYRDELGSGNYPRGKVFIDEISPSRKEVRVLPVSTGVVGLDAIFYNEFLNFSNPGVGKLEFNRRFSAAVKGIGRRQIEEALNDDKKLINLVEPQYATLRNTTIQKVADAINAYEKNPQDILSISEQREIINSAQETIWNEVFNVGWDQGLLLSAFDMLTTYISSFTFEDADAKNGDFYLNFGNGRQYLVTNWANDYITYPEIPNSIVFKLYEPLPKDIKVKNQLWVSRQITPSVIEKVFLLGSDVTQESGYPLRAANWDVEVAGMTGRGTGFETWNSLVSSEVSTSQQIIDHYFSASDMGDVALNIDYRSYYNFIHFGSAEERLKNFKYKMEVVDQYNENIKKTSTYSASVSDSIFVSQSISSFRSKIRQTLNTFDSYERHLYYSSGSYYSGSLITSDTYLVNAIHEWPKQNTVQPYALYPLTSSQATTWYNDQLTIAQAFDRDNIHSFVNNIPVYLSIEEDNEDYLTFIYMIGQHFDILYSYIKQLTLISNRDESLYEGLAKDLTYNVAKSMGFDLKSGQDNTSLWKYAFGFANTGSYSSYSTGSGTSISGSGETHMSSEDASKEIWRRILNNLPFMLKTKGTERSIRALLACYGIPTSLLTIREYGGPDPRDYENFEDKSAWIFDDFVYAIDFEGSQSVSATWEDYYGSIYPQTIEFRFAAAPTTKPTQSLFNTAYFAINLLKDEKV